MVARLTPDQKVACSSHVGVKKYFSPQFPLLIRFYIHSNSEQCCVMVKKYYALNTSEMNPFFEVRRRVAAE